MVVQVPVNVLVPLPETRAHEPNCHQLSRCVLLLLQGQFTALTGFYVVWAFFKVPLSHSIEDVMRAASRHCAMAWTQAREGGGGGGGCVEGDSLAFFFCCTSLR